MRPLSRLTGYEDVNDAKRLSHDPAMCTIVYRKGLDRMYAEKAGVRPQHPNLSVGWVFDRQIGLIRGGTRLTAPVHDGKCGSNALRDTIVGNCGGGDLGNVGLNEQKSKARSCKNTATRHSPGPRFGAGGYQT